MIRLTAGRNYPPDCHGDFYNPGAVPIQLGADGDDFTAVFLDRGFRIGAAVALDRLGEIGRGLFTGLETCPKGCYVGLRVRHVAGSVVR